MSAGNVQVDAPVIDLCRKTCKQYFYVKIGNSDIKVEVWHFKVELLNSKIEVWRSKLEVLRFKVQVWHPKVQL